ncbi:CG9572, partial [Drosophila busckii]
CQPSPCGANSECRVNGNSPSCSCLPEFLGSPPNCRPQCISNSECPSSQACVNQKCVDPCPGLCGLNANCRVFSHTAMCLCQDGYTGDPFSQCSPQRAQPIEQLQPCNPSPCGINAKCEARGDAGSCTCLPEYFGNPYEGCRPECVQNSDCPSNRACVNQKCRDPCPGTCGANAECQVISHSYVCECSQEYIGNPYEGCRPECIGNSECAANRACIRQKCADPCPGTCGQEAHCSVNNHIPICSCPAGYTGNAFVQCTRQVAPITPKDPCYPSPCGLNSVCRVQRDQAVCECLPGFFGNPLAQGCRPECTLSSDCAKDRACVNNKCVDACAGVCGYGAVCQTINHSPICSCPDSMVGNPFVQCEAPR